MAYVVRTVPRDQLVPGKDWLLIRSGDGDELCFLLANDTTFDFTPEQVDVIVGEIFNYLKVSASV